MSAAEMPSVEQLHAVYGLACDIDDRDPDEELALDALKSWLDHATPLAPPSPSGGPPEGMALLAEIATDVGRLVKLVADGAGPAEHEALFAAIDPLDTDDVKAYLYAAVLAIATLRDTPPSPPLVWRRLADEWPEEDQDVWVFDRGAVRLSVCRLSLGSLYEDDPIYLLAGDAHHLGIYSNEPDVFRDVLWLPAAVPTPPAPEGETTE